MDTKREVKMALHKMVNGVRVDLSPEEEAAVEAEWAANRLAAEAKIKDRRDKAAEKDRLKKSAMLKLKSVGLDEAEIAALLGKQLPENQGG